MSDLKAFENVKNQIGHCGIWCGSCGGGNGTVQELARRFEEIVKNYKLEKYAPKEFDFNEFMKGLAGMQAMPLCPGCREGGGLPTCKVKLCAREKGMPLCNQCNQITKCQNFEQLKKDHPKIKEDLMKIGNKKESIEKWMRKLKRKWPHCILLCTQVKNGSLT